MAMAPALERCSCCHFLRIEPLSKRAMVVSYSSALLEERIPGVVALLLRLVAFLLTLMLCSVLLLLLKETIDLISAGLVRMDSLEGL